MYGELDPDIVFAVVSQASDVISTQRKLYKLSTHARPLLTHTTAEPDRARSLCELTEAEHGYLICFIVHITLCNFNFLSFNVIISHFTIILNFVYTFSNWTEFCLV